MIKLLENKIPIVQFILDTFLSFFSVKETWTLSKIKFELNINCLQLTCNDTEFWNSSFINVQT